MGKQNIFLAMYQWIYIATLLIKLSSKKMVKNIIVFPRFLMSGWIQVLSLLLNITIHLKIKSYLKRIVQLILLLNTYRKLGPGLMYYIEFPRLFLMIMHLKMQFVMELSLVMMAVR